MRLLLSLLLNKVGNLPQPFNAEQRWFSQLRSGFRCTSVISQTGGNGSVIAIRHANDQVRIRPSVHTNELDTLAVQRMLWMHHRYPFRRHIGKRGSML